MRTTRRLRAAIVIPALALLPLAGCFDTANTNELSCTLSKYCPEGYVCVGAQTGSPGKCQKVSDGGGLDTSPDTSALLDGPVPPLDSPQLVVDTSVVLDQSPSLDISASPDLVPDVATAVDLSRDFTPDAPLVIDIAADSTVALPDVGPDKGPDVGPDITADFPYGPEVGPDVPPTGCVIGGTSYGAYYTNGTSNPANACQTCQTTYALTSWTASASGTTCGTGQVCSGGTCQSGCWIAGALIGSGATNSSNACQICKPATSTSAWSSNTDGTSCGGGRSCSGGTCGCPAPTTDCGTSGCINVNGNDGSHCGSCTNVCATNQLCSSGSCQCTLGAPACGGCLAWNFEWGSAPSPWALELASNLTGANGATNIAITQSKYHGGNSALIAPVLIDMTTTYDAEVAVSTSCANNIAGYSMSAWVFLSGPELTSWNNNLIVDTWGPSGLGDNSVLYWGDIPTGAWFQITTSFVSAVPINRMGIRLTPNTNWVGTMYVDDVVITGL